MLLASTSPPRMTAFIECLRATSVEVADGSQRLSARGGDAPSELQQTTASVGDLLATATGKLQAQISRFRLAQA